MTSLKISDYTVPVHKIKTEPALDLYKSFKRWYEAKDPRSGETYYYNANGKTSWAKPAESAAGDTSALRPAVAIIVAALLPLNK